MALPAKQTELQVAISIGKQANITTAPVIGKFARISMVRSPTSVVTESTEDDAGEYGFGDEFARTVYKTSADARNTISKYMSSQFAAFAFTFGLGGVTLTGSGPYVYTCVPQVTASAGIELPYFSILEQMRPGGSSIIDRTLIGNAIKRVTCRLVKGPGRQNSTIAVDWIGSGLYTEPSALTMPAVTPENFLSAAGLALTINGFDYVTSRNFESLEFGFENNVDENGGYRPGSGFNANGFQVRNSIEIGTRQPFLNAVARFKSDSPEIIALRAQTTGTAVVNLTQDANNSLVATYEKFAYKSAVIGETNGIVTVSFTASPLYDATNGVLSVVATTPLGAICQ